MIDGRRNSEHLPDLADFERYFQRPGLFIVGEAIDFCVNDLNATNVEWEDEMRTVGDPFLALTAENHGGKNTEHMYGNTIDRHGGDMLRIRESEIPPWGSRAQRSARQLGKLSGFGKLDDE